MNKNSYKARRDALLELLPDNSVVVIPSNPSKLRNGDDNTFNYRQSSEVLYLTGFPEDSALLVLSKIAGVKSFIMFVHGKDASEEQWHGKRFGPGASRVEFGADRVYNINSLKKRLPVLLGAASQLYITVDVDRDRERQVRLMAEKAGVVKKRHRSVVKPLSELRLIKSPEEIVVMERSGAIGAHGHNAALLQCHPGLSEMQLRSYIEHVFMMNGATGPAYGTIVATGENGNCLHHPAGEDILQDGHMVLVDAGSELAGYASDITRTYPVNGKFSPAQREIYELVLAAQEAAIKLIKPGEYWPTIDQAADDVIAAGLAKLGFQLAKPGDKAKAGQEALTLGVLYPHGLGHWLGLDVHDVGEKSIGTGKTKKEDRPFQEGMVFTVEPGLYLSTTDERIPERYRGINVRIEDNILVTADGCKVLTRGAFKSVEDIEQMMAHGAALRAEIGDEQMVVPPLLPAALRGD